MSNSAIGRFVWHDLMTTSVPKASGFYRKLFKWKLKKLDMGPMGQYTMFAAGGIDLGGMVKLDKQAGLPSHWITYVGVRSVDAICRKVPKLGGRVCVPPTDIPNIGRFAVIEDPHGIVISPFSWTGEPPAEGEPGTFGGMGFCELHTPDAAVSAAFYSNLFGWKIAGDEHGPWRHVRSGRRDIGGMLQMEKGRRVRAGWLTYMLVDNAKAAVKAARDLGGKTIKGTTTIPEVGSFAILQDPTGATFAVFEPAPVP